MRAWSERPIEVTNLLNPAFCSLLLRDSIVSFHKEKEQGMPYPLSFLVLPLVLHKPTRDMLPDTIRTRLYVWLGDHPEVYVRFAQRTRQLVPYTKESLTFGVQKGIIDVTEDGNLIPVQGRLKTLSWPTDAEPAICRRKAQFLGRWFAQAGEVATIFAMWGIRP